MNELQQALNKRAEWAQKEIDEWMTANNVKARYIFVYGTGRTLLGQCRPRQKEIMVTVNLVGNFPKFKSTLYHEIAHALVIEVYNNKREKHGPLWHAVISKMGYPDEKATDNEYEVKLAKRR